MSILVSVARVGAILTSQRTSSCAVKGDLHMTAVQPTTRQSTIEVRNPADGTVVGIPTQSREVLWYPYSRRKTRLAMGVVRAAAAHGLRRVGLKPRGGAR